MEEAGWRRFGGEKGQRPSAPLCAASAASTAASVMSARQGRDGMFPPARGNARQRGPGRGDALTAPLQAMAMLIATALFARSIECPVLGEELPNA